MYNYGVIQEKRYFNMLKKLLCAIIIGAMAVCCYACGGDGATTTNANTSSADTNAQTSASENEQSTDAQTDAQTVIIEETADVSAVELLEAVLSSIENLPDGVRYDSADNAIPAINFCSLFGGEIEFDDDLNPIYPEIMNKIDSYAMHIASGKSPICVDVFKLKDGQDRSAVTAICEKHHQQIKDMMFGYDQEGVMEQVENAKGQVVYAKGKYVVMLSVLDPSAAIAKIDAKLLPAE